jgi:hypothetical protein
LVASAVVIGGIAVTTSRLPEILACVRFAEMSDTVSADEFGLLPDLQSS